MLGPRPSRSRGSTCAAAQRRGLGGRLLAAALAAFPDRRSALLEVQAQNLKGRAFYVQEGFVATGERTIEAFGSQLRVVVMERGGGAPGSTRPSAP